MGARVLAIVGTGRSGSTLLAFLLNTHPSVATVGELTGPPPGADGAVSRCSCGQTLADCPFWTRLSAAVAARGHRFGAQDWDLRFTLRGGRLLTRSLRHATADRVRDGVVLRVPASGRRLQTLAERSVAVVEEILALTAAEVLADASKDPVRVHWLARLTDLDLRVVHLVRDPLGYAGSRLRRGVAPGTAAREWVRMAGHVHRLLAELPPGRTLRLRYEDLCADPVAQLDRVAALAGVAPFDPARVRTWPGPDHHVIGNRMRLSAGGPVALDETWRERLSRHDVDRVLRTTGDQRAAFGYG